MNKSNLKRHWNNWLKPTLEVLGAFGCFILLNEWVQWWIHNGLNPTVAKIRGVIFALWLAIVILLVADWRGTRRRKKAQIKKESEKE